MIITKTSIGAKSSLSQQKLSSVMKTQQTISLPSKMISKKVNLQKIRTKRH
jgi:hypothetical protein